MTEQQVAKIRAVVHLVGLAAEAAAGISGVVRRMHQQIYRSVVPLSEQMTLPSLHEPIYELVQGSLQSAAELARQWPGSDWPEHPQWQGILGAVRGVVGDHLETTGHPLVSDIELRDRNGQLIQPENLVEQQHIAIFVHGLCMNESAFSQPGFQSLFDVQAAAGWTIVFVRYNSGLSIAENGRRLAMRLAQLRATQLMLLGHSMGGLVIRAAYGQEEASVWVDKLRLAVYLGSPHAGAPLERLGNQANALLGLSPWTQPLMQLGMIRSQGIQDLRHGAVGHSTTQLPAGATHLLIAGEFEESKNLGVGPWVGDGLVPVASALAQDADGNSLLQASCLIRKYFAGVGHLGLLSNTAVLDCIQEYWNNLQTSATQDIDAGLAQDE